MLARKSLVDQVEITRSNAVQVRIALLIVDGDVEVNSRWHRTSIEPGGDVQAQMDYVNQHLVSMGESPVSQADIDRVVAIFNAVPSE